MKFQDILQTLKQAFIRVFFNLHDSTSKLVELSRIILALFDNSRNIVPKCPKSLIKFRRI